MIKWSEMIEFCWNFQRVIFSCPMLLRWLMVYFMFFGEIMLVSTQSIFIEWSFCGKNIKEYVETSVTNYVGLKRQTTLSILPDPESAKQHIQNRNLQCYQSWYCTDHWLMQIDPCTSWWTRNTDGELLPL